MLVKMLVAAVLVAITVAVHAGGLGLVLWMLSPLRGAPPTRPAAVTWLLIRVTWLLILIHVAAITVWALFYWRMECLPDAESAFYFSGVTYTTLGYGDLVLPKAWRILGPIEGLTGILMSGLSASAFFAIVAAVYFPRAGPGSR
jgi:hypothetical protein